VVLGVPGHRLILPDARSEVRAAERRGVRRGDADEVAGVRERRVEEGRGRAERVEIGHVDRPFGVPEDGVRVRVDHLTVEVVRGERPLAERDRVRVAVDERDVPAVRGSARAADTARRRRVQVRLRAGLSLAVRPERRHRHVAVQLLLGVEEHRSLDAVARLVGHRQRDRALRDLHGGLRRGVALNATTRREPHALYPAVV